MSVALADKLQGAGHKLSACGDVVCSPLGKCVACIGKISCKLIVRDKRDVEQTLTLQFKILETLAYDIIVGREAMARHDLYHLARPTDTVDDSSHEAQWQNHTTQWLSAIHPTAGTVPPSHQTRVAFAPVKSVAKEDALDVEPDDTDDMSELAGDLGEVPDYTHVDSTTLDDILSLVTFHGTPDEQRQLKELVTNYKDIFSKTVNSEPALVTPMEIEVDIAEWNHPRNRGPPRVTTPQKQEAIYEQVTELLKHNVIKK